MKIDAVLDVDVVAIEQNDTVQVMVDIAAPSIPEDPGAPPRPASTVIVVLDRSGSMAGHPLEAAKRAVLSLVERLDDRDTLGFVTFDNRTEIVVPARRVGDLGRDQIRRLVAGVQPGGMTDLSGGYLMGLEEARRTAGAAGATIILLSDGHANSGTTDPQTLRDLAAGAGAQAITTSTIGIGQGYDEAILGEMAIGGNGNHTFALDADAAAGALVSEVEGLLSKTVQAATLMIRPTSEVVTVGVLNELPSHAVEGGVLVELGDFYSGEVRRLLLRLEVPAIDTLGVAEVAALEISFTEIPALVHHSVSLPIAVNVVPGDEAAGRVRNPDVQREALLLQSQRAKRASMDALAQGDVRGAQSHLDGAMSAFMSAPRLADAETAAEVAWLAETRDALSSRDASYNSKRMRSDHSRKARGHKNRTQGGERGSDPEALI